MDLHRMLKQTDRGTERERERERETERERDRVKTRRGWTLERKNVYPEEFHKEIYQGDHCSLLTVLKI